MGGRTVSGRGIALVVVAAIAGLTLGNRTAPPARAGNTLTVTTTGDTITQLSSCPATGAAGYTLRCAILQANADATGDTITFSIPSTDTNCKATTINGSSYKVCTISPTSALPTLNADTTTINGYTQTSASPNTNTTIAAGDNAIITVRVDGTNAGSGAIGLNVGSSDDIVEGLSITDFSGGGIDVSNSAASGDIVAGNFLGVAPDGSGHGNGYGVTFTAAGTLGGTSLPNYTSKVLGAMDVVSGNTGNGVQLGTSGNVVEANLVGTGPSGASAVANAGDGVYVSGANHNTIGGSSATVGNIISGNTGNGVHITSSSSSNTVASDLIGLNAAGTSALANGQDGVRIEASINNTVGGSTTGTRNIISGNSGNGVSILADYPPSCGLATAPSTGNTVSGNFIGTNSAGGAAVGNGKDGIRVSGSSNNVLGGTAGNVVSGNSANGIELAFDFGYTYYCGDSYLSPSNGTAIGHSYIGTTAAGTAALPNGGDGIYISASSNDTVGGVGAGNVVSGNAGYGVQIDGSGTSYNYGQAASTGDILSGNRIGTDAPGSVGIGNGGVGVYVSGAGSSGNTIGGTAAGAGNVISGNHSNLSFNGYGAGGVVINAGGINALQGNYIGTNAAGTAVIQNSGTGVDAETATTIGGSATGAGNIIAGNTGNGIIVHANGSTIQGNYVGTNASGASGLGNGTNGIYTLGGATASITGNTVADNPRSGIRVGSSSSDTTHVPMSQNSIYDNGGLGIDLAPQGVVDCADTPPGPNDYTPCPVINAASITDINGTACDSCTVELFIASNEADDQGYGEGQTFLGSVQADPSTGAWDYTPTTNQMSAGQYVTATATTPSSPGPAETSEFAQNVVVAGPPGPATQFVVSAPSSATAGSSFNVTVTAEDAKGNQITNYTGTVHLTSTDSQAVLPSDYTFTSGDAGTHTFTVTLKSAGNQTVTATDTSSSSLTGASGSISVAPTGASTLVVQAPSTAGAGSPVSVKVTAKDPYNNVATGYAGTVHITSSDRHATLPADYTFTNSDAGVHTLSVTLVTTGNQTVTATDTTTSAITGASGQVNVSPSAATHLAISGAPSTATAGSGFNVTVTALDTYGNTATGYLGTVHFTSTDSQAVLPADYTFAAGDNGVHTFSVTLETAGSRTVTATDTLTSSITGVSSGVSVGPAGAYNLVVSAPSSATAGTPFSLQLTAQDQYGNVATGYTGTVHLTSTDAHATLPADYTFVSADNGSHTFSGSSAVTLVTAGSRTINAADTSASSISGTSGAIAVGPGPATHFTVTAPGNGTAGAKLSVVVTALDAYGNTAGGYLGTVHFTTSDAQATLPDDYNFTGPNGGTHSFSVTLRTAGNQTVTATDTTTSSITGATGAIAVAPAAASGLQVTAPAAATAGSPLTVTITAQDPYGNTATGYAGTVHLTSTDAHAVLPADYTFTAGDNGVHTFTDGVTLDTAGGQSIMATDTAAASIARTSSVVSVGPAATSRLAVTLPSATAAATTTNVVVTALDRFGNVTPAYAGTVSFTSSDGAAALPASYGFTAGDAGVHSFAVTLNTVGTQSLAVADTATSPIHGSGTTAVGVQIGRGWNLLDVPVSDPTLMGANAVAASINTSLLTTAVRVAATYANGAFSMYIPGYSQNLALSQYQGVLVLSTASGLWQPQGASYSSAMPVPLSAGWNLAGAPFPYRGITTSAIASEAQQCNVQEIATFNGGTYTTWLPSQGASGAFLVPAVQGMWILCAGSGSWEPQ